uniref:Uncharacterized protein n=1 Tax=Hyaloperonospora arabidopsidis (strain Emoy2) TaxID=559515 RepID=M4BEA7_HYAAE
MALLSQPILKGYAYESPFCAVRASLLADSSNSVARTLSRQRFVNILQNFGFARLEVTPEQARIPSDAFDRVRKKRMLTKMLAIV